MTPREKAKELVDKMLIGFVDWTYHIPMEINDNHTILSEAKQRALIAVYELIYSHSQDTTDNQFYYWQEVKQEIKKL